MSWCLKSASCRTQWLKEGRGRTDPLLDIRHLFWKWCNDLLSDFHCDKMSRCAMKMWRCFAFQLPWLHHHNKEHILDRTWNVHCHNIFSQQKRRKKKTWKRGENKIKKKASAPGKKLMRNNRNEAQSFSVLACFFFLVCLHTYFSLSCS